MSSLVFTTIYTLFGVLELFHIMAHCNVLIPVGRKPLRASIFYNTGWYFFIDTFTVFFNLLFITRLFSWYSPILLLIVFSQMMQHFYFALFWSPEVERVKSIVEWSVQDPQERKLRSDHVGKIVGTSYDVLTHATCLVLDITSIYELTTMWVAVGSSLIITSLATLLFLWYIRFAFSKPLLNNK